MQAVKSLVRARFVVVLLGVLWITAISFGMWAMMVYQETPGHAAAPPAQWPQSTLVSLSKDRATLVIAAHPKCPCTRATISELNSLMAACKGKVRVHVLFFKPADSSADWEKTDLWQSAAAIPDVQVHTDIEGREARRFRASISGQTALFDSEGKLLFSGGITGSRGDVGDNAGRSAVVSLITTGHADRNKTFVFGCSLGNQKAEGENQVAIGNR